MLRRQPRPMTGTFMIVLFVSSGVLVFLLLMTPAASFVGKSVKMFMHVVAASAAASGDLHVSEVLFTIVGLCHVLVSCWNILDSSSCAFGALVLWKCDCQDALARFAPGLCKKQSGYIQQSKRF